MIITIDGPVASGKSSVAKVLAEKLDIYYLYTGLLYRAVAYILIDKLRKPDLKTIEKYLDGIKPEDISWIHNISYEYKNEEANVFFEEKEIAKYLHDVSLEQFASIVSANEYVRNALFDLQRKIAEKNDVIAEGRDCGTVIFPNADYKFYLTSSLETPAYRLAHDERRGEVNPDIEKIKKEIEIRDKRDKERVVAPLAIPENAIIIDNSELTLSETISEFLSFIKT